MSKSPHAVYRVRPDLRVVCASDEVAFLITETERRRIIGPLYVRLLSTLSEPLSLDELTRQLEPDFPAELALHGLQKVLESGYVVETDSDAPAAYPLRPRRSGSVPLSLDFIGSRADPVIARTLVESGFAIVPEAEISLLVVEDYLDPRLAARIAALEERGTGSYLPFKPYGSIAWLGPRFEASRGPCFECLVHRLQVNRPIEMYLQGEGHALESLLPRALGSEASVGAATLFAACELLRVARNGTGSADAPPALELLTLELETMTRRTRTAIRRPQCARCGDLGLMRERLQRPVELSSRKKVDTSDGGHRIESAESTHRRLAGHVDPLLGAISDLSEMPHKNNALCPVFSASHYLRPASREATSDERFHQVSVGKGRTAAQARTSALCEALERQCARYQGDELRVRGSYDELRARAIDPRQLLLFSERQYQTKMPEQSRARLLATPRSQLVPRPFNPEQVIDWTPSWSLSRGVQKLVPFTYVFAGAPRAMDERVCNWDSNGCAAGNCVEEAILQGLLELVERDATAIWWYNRLELPGLELESFDQPYFIQVREHYERAGYELWLLDLTHDLEIPVVIALAAERAGERYAAGLGCHLDLGMAAQRAITELHQVFDPERRHAPLFTRAELDDERFLRPAPRTGAAVRARPPVSTDLREDLEFCLRRLSRAGLELLLTDYSRPDVELSTVKVIVPGLRHFWPRFAPGRLYDVPVALGNRARPLSESELNPLPLLM
jgi:oxazoline/thiazoline synthase